MQVEVTFTSGAYNSTVNPPVPLPPDIMIPDDTKTIMNTVNEELTQICCIGDGVGSCRICWVLYIIQNCLQIFQDDFMTIVCCMRYNYCTI